jgi:hypothetical protein
LVCGLKFWWIVGSSGGVWQSLAMVAAGFKQVEGGEGFSQFRDGLGDL